MKIDESAIALALDEPRSLVQADGADMRLLGVDDAGIVSLELILEGASCAECVLPRGLLEQIVLDMLMKKTNAVAGVTIKDPREQRGWVAESH